MQQIWIKTTNQEMLAQDQRKANKFKKTTNLCVWWNSSKSVLIYLFDKHKDKYKRQKTKKDKTRTITMTNTKKIVNQPV